MADIREKMKEKGWRQGDILPFHENIAQNIIDQKPTMEHSEKVMFCLASHDCDIVNDREKEPFIELLQGNKIEKRSPENMNIRNPRILDIQVQDLLLRFCIHDRFRVPKDIFLTITRDENNQPDETTRNIIRRWLANRYVRSAFPDAFNRRLESKQFEKLLKSDWMKHARQILVNVCNDELGENDEYHISVIVEVEEGLPQEIADTIECHVDKAFSSCKGISIDNLRIAVEDDITLHDLRTYRKLEYDFRSLPEAMPPYS